jgi:hypothetical protein
MLNLVGCHVLGDAAGFARNNVGIANVIEEGRFTVIHVTHHDYNRRTF